MSFKFEIPEVATEDANLIWNGDYFVPMREDPKVVLDIGGNVGLFSAWAAQQWPEAQIWAYEPWQENIDMFLRNMQPFPRVSLVKSALLDRNGLLPMSEDRNPMCHRFEGGIGPKRDVVTLDAKHCPKAQFIKIDAEGSEFTIISRLDLSEASAIVIEAHSFGDADKITGFLDKQGFALHSRRNEPNGCALIKFMRRSELPTAPKAMIAFPTYGGSPTVFWESVIKLSQNPPCQIALKSLAGDSLVSRARNTLTAEFLQSDCTDLIFIDSDLIFSPDHVGRLMSHEADLVAGFYPKKQDGPLRWVCNAKLHETKPDDRGLQEVRYMGTGFMRIRRAVFEQMIAMHGDLLRYTPDSNPSRDEYDFWGVGVYKYPDGTRRYLSEDWMFCQRWLDLGGKVYGDTKIVLRHVGHAVYPLYSQQRQIANPELVDTPNSGDTH